MKKKLLIIFLITALTAAMCGYYGVTFASTATEKQNELDNIQDQQDQVSDDLSALASRIKTQQAAVDKLEAEISAKEADIAEAEQEIAKKKAEIQDRKNGLNARLRTMYKSGTIGYLDVILGSHSVSDLISNVQMVQEIYKADQKTLANLKQQHAELVAKEAELQTQKASLNDEKSKAQEKQASLQTDKQALQAKYDKLQEEADQLVDEIKKLQDTTKVYTGGTFLWPTTSTVITSPFGMRTDPYTGIYTGHTGIDIGVGTGSPVYAAASGTVIIAGTYGGYGYAVVIDHGSGISTLYGHNSQLLVSVGQKVERGQTISYSGSTGWSTGPHLHFEVRVNGAYVDPMSYFN